jgi:hypothetical protein
METSDRAQHIARRDRQQTTKSLHHEVHEGHKGKPEIKTL